MLSKQGEIGGQTLFCPDCGKATIYCVASGKLVCLHCLYSYHDKEASIEFERAREKCKIESGVVGSCANKIKLVRLKT